MRRLLMALGLVLALGACGGGTAGQDAGLLVDGAVDLLDGSHLDLADTGLEIGKDGVAPDSDQLALPDQSDTFDTLYPDTQDTWHPDTSDTNTPDTVPPDTQDTNTPDTVPTCDPACGPYQLCNLETLLCEANPLCQTEFCAGEDAGMEKVQGLALYYLDRFEWPNQQGVVPEGGVASLGAATQKCLSVGKRLCTGLELAIACSPEGQTYPYGNAYNQTACNTELPWAADPSGANEGCHATESGIYDLAGNLAEWSAEGKLFGGTVKEGLDANCARLAAPGDYADPALLGLRCCLAPTDDLDADGAQASLDCDDSNDEVKSGAEEVCNGLDDDCDGQTDNTEDADQDDYNTCTDCNDKSGSIHPGAEDQLGDGVDADCDGGDGTDQDQDEVVSVESGGTDCDDANPLTFPGAPERCDGQDNDCDGNNDEQLSPTVCDDASACTTDSCDSQDKACKHQPILCDDQNECTTDSCAPASGCLYTNRDGDCDDADPCTISDSCLDGACVGMTNACDDSNPCTSDLCNALSGACEHQNVDGPCEDADPCSTEDFCQAGQCQAGAGKLACSDNNDCTTDQCEAGVVCKNPPRQGFCDDGDDCTSEDYCLGGVCTGGSNSCGCDTDDDCFDQNDADWCNGYLYCNKGKTPAVCELLPGSAVKCPTDKDSFCSVQTCTPAIGLCYPTPRNEGRTCAATCTVNPTCQSGQCKGTACSAVNLACAGGTCISNTCTANSKVCDGDFAYLTCNGTGNGWSSSTPCGAGKYCDNGDCKPQVCTPNQAACVGRLAGTCDPKGSALLPGYTDCQTLPATPFCQAGACTTCAPNCTGKVCGDDGCGGSCGTCGAGGSCVEGTRCTYPGTGGVTWVAIPGGTFQMGCSVGDSNCGSDENPVHQVTLTGFEILETEITEGQYQAVMGSNPSANKLGANHPVENINWSQAKAFCTAVGGRLPTEAEWEYAARGGIATRYYCGNDATCLAGIAWYSANSSNKKQPVKGKTANAYGLYDMLGNVWEWTNDWYAPYGAGAQTNPQGPDSGSGRVVRGGSFVYYDHGSLRVSDRYDYYPSSADGILGGRCVRSTSQCIPNCSGKTCGDDGCGGSCGTCGAGQACDSAGTCCTLNAQGRCTYPGTAGVTWVAIPGGTFQMGCSAGDSSCQPDESPAHQVTLTGFEMLETEITEGQYLAVMGGNPSTNKLGANHPVEMIKWSQAKAFCEAIGGRLPTEAEWEYAARGGTATRFYCGSDVTCLAGIAWYTANSSVTKQPVKGKAANAYGLYDMLGNVWEWTNDWYATYSVGAQTNPQGPAIGSSLVFRGVGFDSGVDYLRVSIRYGVSPSYTYVSLGGRCARSK